MPKTGSTPTERRKRSKRKIKSASNSVVPDPPQSLVKLLEKDKSVFAYFSSLQKSLVFDVKRWKDKALRYKAELDELKTQDPKVDNGAPPKTINVSKRKVDDDWSGSELEELNKVVPGRVNGTGRKLHEGGVKEHGGKRPSELKTTRVDIANKRGRCTENGNPDKHNDDICQDHPFTKDDFFADLESSSSMSEGSRADEGPHHPVTESIMNSTAQIKEQGKKFRRGVIEQLVKCFDDLAKVGVHLVDVDWPEEENEASDIEEVLKDNMDVSSMDTSRSDEMKSFININSNKKSTLSKCPEGDKIKEPPLITRRTDIEIVTDIMRSIRSLIRLSSVGTSASFQPFCSSDFVPCCYALNASYWNQKDFKKDLTTEVNGYDIQQHPAAQGFKHLRDALICIDLYCSRESKLSEDGEWEEMLSEINHFPGDFGGNEWIKLESIRVGMRNWTLTKVLHKSLCGEISSSWSEVDRGTRNSTALVFLEEEGDQNENAEFSTNDVKDNTDGQAVPGTKSLTGKIQNRLYLLVERVCYARLVSIIFQHYGDVQGAARLFIEYILSNTPSPQLEDYPRYPPTLSMCIVEALLMGYERNYHSTNSDTPNVALSCKSWFNAFLIGNHKTKTANYKMILRDAIALSVHSASSIWKARSESMDKRVRDMTTVEMAAYERICSHEHEWICKTHTLDDFHKRTPTELGSDLLKVVNGDLFSDEVFSQNKTQLSFESLELNLASLLLSILVGEVRLPINVIDKSISLVSGINHPDHINHPHISCVILSSFRAFITIQRLKWETSCLEGLDLETVTLLEEEDLTMTSLIHQIHKNSKTEDNRYLVETALRCCLLLSDGNTANEIGQALLGNEKTGSMTSHQYDIILASAKYPTVRVINMKSRPDRWRNFIHQARREHLFSLLAVPTFIGDNITLEWGAHAFNGTNDGQLEFERKISSQFGCVEMLGRHVDTHWRPNELKAFDCEARDDDKLVRMSPSERACAMSHVTSWKGVQKSLAILDDMNINEVHRIAELHLSRMFKISGFARGSSILSKNIDMPPQPVCVILEDDAMLVDRFSDRLAKLLEELPRDFHFCSIGYARPKNAPIVQYSSQLGIPTCLWYLTGYILSFEGATHLIQSLPVKGPVDSWIGLKMTANWDNSFGHKIGVGTSSKVLVESRMLPNKKNLDELMGFRSFVALTPLCSQKLGWTDSTNNCDKNKWRERDTDITYSGRL